VCSFVVTWCTFKNIAKAFGVVKLLALAKAFGAILPTAIGEVLYELVNMTLCLQFHDALSFTYPLTSLRSYLREVVR
jgi:hypothetical protein